MKKILKTILNNGFFVLALLIAVTLYLAYGQKQAAQNEAFVAATHGAATSPAVASAAPVAEATTASPTQTSGEASPSADALPGEASPAARTEKMAENDAASTSPADAAAKSETTAAEQQPSARADKAPASARTEKAASASELTRARPASPSGDRPVQKTAERSGIARQPRHAAPADTSEQTVAHTETSTGDTQVRITTATRDTAGHRHSEVHVHIRQSDSPAQQNRPASDGFDPRQLNDRAILSYFSGPREALAAAREAAHEGDYGWSAAIYSSLLKHYPRADLAGELGNVLWRMGEKHWAHRAWRYAAQLLIREGRSDIARTFAHNIAKVDAALSREIEAHLPKTTGPAHGHQKAKTTTQ